MSRDQGPTDAPNMHTTNGGMTNDDDMHVTMYEPAQPWDWIDRMLTAVMRNCVWVVFVLPSRWPGGWLVVGVF